MKFSTKARYAMIALTDLASRGDQSIVTLNDLSRRQNISVTYLEQLFVKLRRAGLVESVRGPRGGYRLKKPADTICVADVLAVVEEDWVTPFGPHFGPPHGGGKTTAALSGTHAQSMNNRLWEGVNACIYVFLHQTKLSDIVTNRLTPCQAVPSMLKNKGGSVPYAP